MLNNQRERTPSRTYRQERDMAKVRTIYWRSVTSSACWQGFQDSCLQTIRRIRGNIFSKPRHYCSQKFQGFSQGQGHAFIPIRDGKRNYPAEEETNPKHSIPSTQKKNSETNPPDNPKRTPHPAIQERKTLHDTPTQPTKGDEENDITDDEDKTEEFVTDNIVRYLTKKSEKDQCASVGEFLYRIWWNYFGLSSDILEPIARILRSKILSYHKKSAWPSPLTSTTQSTVKHSTLPNF